MLNDVQILPAHQIDQDKWNRCINESENGLIYSLYNYLNCMCDNWHGLVVNNYTAIMALPWRRKLGIRYIYQPAFIQQLGLIGNDSNENDQNDSILSSIYSFAKYGDILFNFSNTRLTGKTNAIKRLNLVIDLRNGYNAIAANYKRDLAANLRKVEREKFHILKDHKISLAISMYKETYQQRMKNLSDDDYLRFQSLSKLLQTDGMCFTRNVEDENGQLLAIGLFLRDTKRIYNLMNTTTEEGRSKEANHFLLDEVIREFSDQNLLFDFEGSDIPGVKSFYEKFGGKDQPYFYHHYNRLPKLLRLIKP